ncbi:MAG TPA: DUF5677 domain-containing protein [Acidimicrobiales bacterium]|nr:DUF5677 domain-containing protein [Acidimicrobiales bacterium]
MTLERAAALEPEIAARAPTWRQAARQVVGELGVATRLVIDATGSAHTAPARAVQAIFLQASNDYLDLLFDAASGRGRPATRAARTLFEHELDALDIEADSELATRWLDHLPMAGLAQAKMSLPEKHLHGKALKSFRHRARRLLADNERHADRVAARWGAGFRRQWHPRSLRDRAACHGLLEHYEFYRYASAPVHGSHSGMLGLRKEVAGTLVLRTGPALTPAPLAVLYGTASLRAVVGVGEQFLERGLARLRRALDDLDAAWPEYYVQIHRLDGELWPKSAPSNSGALIVLEPTGEVTWFEYLPDQFLARKARTHDVTIHDEQERALTGLLEEVPSAFPHGRVGVCLHRAVVAEPGDGPWVEAPHLVDFPLFHIYEDGTVGVPSDVASPP